MSRLICTFFLPALFATHANAAIFTVTTTADAGSGSLRDAILQANASAGADEIRFAIPGGGPHTIAPLTALPATSGALLIDGYSQSGAVANTLTPAQGGLNGTLMIELSGQNIPNANGLQEGSAAGDFTVRGLVINRFAISIVSAGNGNFTLEGCYLGTNVAGTSVPGPTEGGLQLGIAGADRIGGLLPAQRNLISGSTGTINGAPGINFSIAAAAGPRIEGNLIGTDVTGTLALGNEIGILVGSRLPPISGTGAIIGGGSSEARNIISGNIRRAIAISCSVSGSICADGLQIAGNYIGTDVSGTVPLPNSEATATSSAIAYFNPVPSSTPTRILIGGYAPNFGNRIAFNRNFGIHSTSVGGVMEFSQNEIFANGGAGIELAGMRANDVGDPDTGPNRLQNFPVLISAQSSSDSEITVRYQIDTATANASYPLTVQFFRAGVNGGSQYLGSDTYASASAQTVKSFVLPTSGPQASELIAIASDAAGNSSEFSDPILVRLFDNGFE